MKAHPTAGTAASNLQAGARLALVGLAVNVAFAFIKIAAGVFGNAYALIADGIESALDAAGSIVIWGGLRFAARPPDATHTYGHGKAEPLAAVIVALAFSWPPLLWRLRAFAKFFYRITGRRHLLSSSSSSPSSSRNRCFAPSADSAAPLTAPRSQPTPGIIAPMPLFQWRQLSEFPSHLSAAKNGNARMIMLPCSPAPSSLPPGRGYSARLCAKFSIPRHAVKLARV